MSQALDMVIDKTNVLEMLYYNYMSLSTLIIDSPNEIKANIEHKPQQ